MPSTTTCWTFLVAASALVSAVSAASLPAEWKKCRRDDPKFDDCLVDAIQDVLPKLKDGIPQLGMLPLDPLEVIALEIEKGDGPVALGLKFKNMKIYGISKSKMLSHGSDPSRYNLVGDALTPEVKIEADYEADGKILLVPVTGKGKCTITLTNLKSHLVHNAVPEEKGGKIYRKETDFVITMDPEHMTLNFENLFNGEKAIEDNLNKFLNENWKEIFADLKPTLETALGRIFLNISNGLFLRVPFDQVFPKE